jgi:DNA invertase Pin-like site-specific DNA recombinase
MSLVKGNSDSATPLMTRPITSEACCSNALAMVAEFESDLIKMRTREGMKVAKAKGRMRGKQPRLKPNQAKRPNHLLRGGERAPCTEHYRPSDVRRRDDRGRTAGVGSQR